MLQKSCHAQERQSVVPRVQYVRNLALLASEAWPERTDEVDESTDDPWFAIYLDDGCAVVESAGGFIQLQRDFSVIAREPIGPGCVEKLWTYVNHYVEAQS
jgi:hypothetical protein